MNEENEVKQGEVDVRTAQESIPQREGDPEASHVSSNRAKEEVKEGKTETSIILPRRFLFMKTFINEEN